MVGARVSVRRGTTGLGLTVQLTVGSSPMLTHSQLAQLPVPVNTAIPGTIISARSTVQIELIPMAQPTVSPPSA